jgi:hypothetical protein
MLRSGAKEDLTVAATAAAFQQKTVVSKERFSAKSETGTRDEREGGEKERKRKKRKQKRRRQEKKIMRMR